MIHFHQDKTDSKQFIEIIDAITNNLIQKHNPDEVSVITIKNWFDHKWLNYSGKQIIQYDTKTQPAISYVLEPYWNKEITIPPFHPNRVLSESVYRKKEIKNTAFEEYFHEFQRSTENRNNLLSRKTKNGLCVWYSSNSEINKQGALMVYTINDLKTHSWYISIEEKGTWKITKTKGIAKNEIESLCSK